MYGKMDIFELSFWHPHTGFNSQKLKIGENYKSVSSSRPPPLDLKRAVQITQIQSTLGFQPE